MLKAVSSFNTASGRYYCNDEEAAENYTIEGVVSIPQAVGTIAM